MSGPKLEGYEPLLAELSHQLVGRVLTPEDPDFLAANQIWNGYFDDYRPAAIAKCKNEADICTAMRILSDSEIPLAVRGGGHHVGGFGAIDGGVVIDLNQLNSVEIGGKGRDICRVGGGATLHDVDTVTATFGRAVPLGVVSPTGVGGLTLSGGIGWLTRKHGYTCDSLISARVVNADGEVVVADEGQNSDLLWGLRGGGGNFGVVTEFEFATYPMQAATVAEALHVLASDEEAEDLLRFYRDWTADLPRGVTAWVVIEEARPEHYAGILPAEHHGRMVLAFLGVDVDSSEAGMRALDDLASHGGPAVAEVRQMDFLDLQHSQDESGAAVSGLNVYMKGEMLEELDDQAIGSIAHHAFRPPTRDSFFEMGLLGGALADRSEMHAAAGLRNSRYIAGYTSMSRTRDGFDEAIQWAREGWQGIRHESAGGVYLNFSGDENAERVRRSLGVSEDLRTKFDRLVEVKRKYDGRNVFKRNHNIDPRADQGLSANE